MTSTGIEPATFRLIAYFLNQLRYRLPQGKSIAGVNCSISIHHPIVTRHATHLSIAICKHKQLTATEEWLAQVGT
jgi:hypothetical protein